MKLDLDIEQFWKDEEAAHEENCFSKKASQVALGIRIFEKNDNILTHFTLGVCSITTPSAAEPTENFKKLE